MLIAQYCKSMLTFRWIKMILVVADVYPTICFAANNLFNPQREGEKREVGGEQNL